MNKYLLLTPLLFIVLGLQYQIFVWRENGWYWRFNVFIIRSVILMAIVGIYLFFNSNN